MKYQGFGFVFGRKVYFDGVGCRYGYGCGCFDGIG